MGGNLFVRRCWMFWCPVCTNNLDNVPTAAINDSAVKRYGLMT